MRLLPLLPVLALAACGDPVDVVDSGGAANEAAAEPMTVAARPVRVGELGPNFQACTAAGTTRRLRAGESLTVRASPFDNAAASGAIPAGARFFVCTRSLDQKWFGIVFDEGGALAEKCGVSEAIARRRDYAGPCRSGWVESAFVKLVAGTGQPVPATPVEGNTGASAGLEG